MIPSSLGCSTSGRARAEADHDALARRVLVRTRKDGGCGAGDPGAAYDLDCVQAIERFVWDGSQRLLELRDYGDTSQTLGDALNQNGTSSGTFFGQVRYTNAGAVDAPLLIAKQGVATFVPQANWAGVYEDGTGVGGSTVSYNWPGRQQDFYMASDARFATIYPNGWYGDVLNATGGADPAGTVYLRNRYYDPLAGQFTQQDPIGLAGGLNVYGFVGGDPVNSSDPFGLCPKNAGGDGKTDTFTDCVSGSGYYANEAAQGRGGFLNDVKGVAATFAESNFGSGDCGTYKGERVLCGTLPDIGGAKSPSEFLKHAQKLEHALEELEELEATLGRLKGPKAQQPIRELIDQLSHDIKGHLKEMRQKWPGGRP
jgi:RHS repeat-associated protein